MKKHYFLFFFKKSISRRRRRVIVASLSVMLAVAIVTGMIGITMGINEKLGSELRAYGANIIVSPREGDYLDYHVIDAILKLDHVEDVAGQVFGRAFINREAVEIIGLDFNSLKDKRWRLSGDLPAKDGEMLAGVNLKDALKLEEGQVLTLENEGRGMRFRVSGFVERGGAEDNAFLISIPDAWRLIGEKGKLNAVLVRGSSGEIEGVRNSIQNNVPTAAAKTIRQVAFAEASILEKIQLLMALVTLVVMFSSSISVTSTMGANVLERREEIGLMKAIGATRKNIRSFYMTEAVLIGFLGGVSGFVFGYIFAQVVSLGAFDSFISIPFYISLLSIAIGLGISLLSSHFPVRNAMRYNPAVILREE